VNRASYRELLQVPGIGPLSARRILEARRAHAFRDLSELRTIGVVVKRARHFLLLDGRYFGGRDVMESQLRQGVALDPHQLSLWSPDEARQLAASLA